VSSSLGRNYSELFPGALGNSYGALRLLVRHVVEAPEGKWENEGLLSREGAHFLGWDRHVGNERP
jgi:hypothetical protein